MKVLIWSDMRHNHARKMAKMIAEGKIPNMPPGTIRHLDIFHDDWCKVFSGGYCNCDPDIVYRAPAAQPKSGS